MYLKGQKNKFMVAVLHIIFRSVLVSFNYTSNIAKFIIYDPNCNWMNNKT